MPLGLGSAAGPYKILRLLGSGGMGTVYLARDTRLDRRIALKVLHDAPDTSARARLLHEARAASALNHPNICQLYDVGEHDGLPWIAMEYVEGRPLEQMIPAGGLDPDEALRIAIQIADALAHAHARGIVHRDLKPPNVACDVDGRTRILDFGIAGRLPRDVAGQVTGPNGDLWIVPAGGGTPRQLTNDLREGGWPVWTPDGRWIVFSSARAGSRTLWQVPAAGGEPIPLTTGAGEDDEPELAADGSRIVYSNVRHNWDLRVRDLATGSERVLLERRTEVLFPRFSPDGRHLTFFGRADYAVAIWTMDVDGTSLKQLTASRELNHMPRWAPGGDAIYFYQAAPTVSFRRIPAAGGASTEFRKWTWEEQTEAGFDPTGRFIAYTRERPLDRPSDQPVVVMIQDAETGGERALHSEHSHMGRWSPDGREIAVWRHDGRVWRCEVEASRCQVVTEGTKPAWSGDGQRIYVMRGPAEAAEVWSVDRQGGDERLEASLGSFRSADRHVDVSRDGLLAWAPWHPGEPALWTATLR